jgi:ligand-binding sensor domain-containing protein
LCLGLWSAPSLQICQLQFCMHFSSHLSFDNEDNLWRIKNYRLTIKQSSLPSCYLIKDHDIKVFCVWASKISVCYLVTHFSLLKWTFNKFRLSEG